MKFAFFGYDTMLPSLERLVDDGHKCAAVFSFKGEIDESKNLSLFAKKIGADFYLDRPKRQHIDNLEKGDIDAFIIAGYPWRVPVPKKAMAVNFHPSLLPQGRGIMPIPHIILSARDAAGVTLHVLEEGFDTGAIITQKALPLMEHENVDTLGARAVMAAPDILSDFMKSPYEKIANATPQNEAAATSFALPTPEMRSIRWDMNKDEIVRKVLAFGRFGAVCQLDGVLYTVCDAFAWDQAHNFSIGALAHKIDGDFIVAVNGGFVRLQTPQEIKDQ